MTTKEMLYQKVENEYSRFLEECKTKPIKELVDMSIEISTKKAIYDIFLRDTFFDDEDFEFLNKFICPLEMLSNLWCIVSGSVSNEPEINEEILYDLFVTLQDDPSLYSDYELEVDTHCLSAKVPCDGDLTAKVLRNSNGKESIVVEYVPSDADENYCGPMIIVNASDNNQLQCHIYRTGNPDEKPIIIALDTN